MQKVAQIGLMSAAKMGAILGLIEGILLAIFSFFGLGLLAAATASAPVPGAQAAAEAMIGLSGMVAVGMIIGCLIGGLVFSAIAAFIYNVVAKFAGGIEVELK